MNFFHKLPSGLALNIRTQFLEEMERTAIIITASLKFGSELIQIYELVVVMRFFEFLKERIGASKLGVIVGDWSE